MNVRSAALKALLKKRNMTFAKLARAAKINVCQLSLILAESRNGKCSWPRIKDVLSDEEQKLVTDLYGPVFGPEDHPQINADSHRLAGVEL